MGALEKSIAKLMGKNEKLKTPQKYHQTVPEAGYQQSTQGYINSPPPAQHYQHHQQYAYPMSPNMMLPDQSPCQGHQCMCIQQVYPQVAPAPQPMQCGSIAYNNNPNGTYMNNSNRHVFQSASQSYQYAPAAPLATAPLSPHVPYPNNYAPSLADTNHLMRNQTTDYPCYSNGPLCSAPQSVQSNQPRPEYNSYRSPQSHQQQTPLRNQQVVNEAIRCPNSMTNPDLYSVNYSNTNYTQQQFVSQPEYASQNDLRQPLRPQLNYNKSPYCNQPSQENSLYNNTVQQDYQNPVEIAHISEELSLEQHYMMYSERKENLAKLESSLLRDLSDLEERFNIIRSETPNYKVTEIEL